MTSKIRPRALLLRTVLVLAAGCSWTPTPADDSALTTASQIRVLETGTKIIAAMLAEISTAKGVEGDFFTLRVTADVRSGDGVVVIPAGSLIRARITAATRATDTLSTSTLGLGVSTLTLGGKTYLLYASLDSVATVSESGGFTNEGGLRVAEGDDAGAIERSVVSGVLKEGTIGAPYDGNLAPVVTDTDIVLPEGTRLTLSLQQPLVVGIQ